jgi:hypothetical protein
MESRGCLFLSLYSMLACDVMPRDNRDCVLPTTKTVDSYRYGIHVTFTVINDMSLTDVQPLRNTDNVSAQSLA